MLRPRERTRSGDRVAAHLTPLFVTPAYRGARFRVPIPNVLTPAGQPAGSGRSLVASEARVQPSEVR